MRKIKVFLFTLILLWEITPENILSQSTIYIGGHIRRERPNTITTLKNSGFDCAILFNVNVESDGTLTTDGDTICYNGEYVFGKKHPYYISDIKSLKEVPTNITRIEICIGGWGNESYNHIKSLINSAGVGSNTVLYRNFKILKDILPEIDAVNNDDEHAYDVNTAVKFHVMMAGLGYKSTLAPYTNKSYWTDLATGVNNSVPGTVDRVLIQCYDGGAGNNPADWHINNIPLHAGRLNYQDFNETKNVMQTWKDQKGVVGGFFWVYNDETWNLSKYAIATNRIFGSLLETPIDSIVAVSCEDKDYGGYNINLKIGNYKTLDMVRYGLANNDVSSLKVKPGYKVTLYSEDNFAGDSLVFIRSSSWIGDAFNDKTSSLKIEYINTSGYSENYFDEVSIFPNPASTDVTISCTTTEKDVSVYNLSGEIVYKFDLQEGDNHIVLGNIPCGLYFILGKYFRQKLLIKN
ncbi:MAG: T9SS type A sorting domain-containing protein [Paludibacter sp.]|jgi:hypothetical protein|nr:T9SS type A sorting domain-containing protein [Paludibacter sp.]